MAVFGPLKSLSLCGLSFRDKLSRSGERLEKVRSGAEMAGTECGQMCVIARSKPAAHVRVKTGH